MSFPRFPTDPTYPSICGYLYTQYRVIRSYNHRLPTDTCVNSCILYSMSNNNGIPVLFADNLMLPLMPLQRLSVDGECRMAAHRLLGCCPSVHPSGCLSVRSVVWERCIIIRTFVIKWKITKAAVNYLPQVLGKVEKTLHGLGHLVLDAYFHMVYR